MLQEGDTCPVGCERATFDAVCQLRERRLDQDDLIAEVTKTIESERDTPPLPYYEDISPILNCLLFV